ncbi:LysM domain-containing protein [Polyangium sp. y55x31]|uniref:LysM peptidoglycan-binding domain-containing protein n=1 Tax=Polyangium sp. y55x31 TaxID=3042688 RepID=UPI0024832210|nr:LysM domain-containing protein [Polyangium sp. y55x31]MDI1476770.1 LysM domain-containing protein [Polyangium sp. y55x31]
MLRQGLGRRHGPWGITLACVATTLALTLAPARPADAFPHVVRSGETLAQIAERVYGRVEMEQILVAANSLDAGRGLSIVPGMRLEIPSVGHHRVTAGETWTSLADTLLGHPERSDVLAFANEAKPWIQPTEGQEIRVPYNLRYVAGPGDSTLTVAYRFLGQRDKAWMLDRYNRLGGESLQRGDVVLVPLTELELTAEGKALAASAGALVRSEGAGQAREAQRRAEVELPQLAADVRNGRYVDAVTRGNRLLGSGDLSRTQLAQIQQRLVEAYVALDAQGLAETACLAWREADPSLVLDPIELSPKIVRACTNASTLGAAAPPAAVIPSVPASASAAPSSPRRSPVGGR